MCVLIFQDGLLRVLLDGGPSRVFSQGDAKLFEEDLDVLKVKSMSMIEILCYVWETNLTRIIRFQFDAGFSLYIYYQDIN